MERFYVVVLPGNTTTEKYDLFFTEQSHNGTTIDIKKASQFLTEGAAIEKRSGLNSLWRCCAQVRTVEIIPPVERQFNLLPAGHD